MEETFDIAVVGGGIVGLASALAINERYPRCSLTVLEKEPEVGSHQTGHNSGVIHAGIYYKPGSYKAMLCVEGVRLMKSFCEESGVAWEPCGKVIVATDDSELARLEELYRRGVANGVSGLELIGPDRLREIEPHARAVRALLSPGTAIVDFKQVTEAMGRRLAARGVSIRTGARVKDIQRAGTLQHINAGESSVTARFLLNCAGLQADLVARMAGVDPGVSIIPFRGEYYNLKPECRLVRALIYPVPDPAFPFLGVHFTRRIGGGYEAGPNAVLAFAREGYRKSDVDLAELGRMVSYPGFWIMGLRYWRMGAYEYYRSFSRRAFVRALSKLVPDISEDDLSEGGSGVRAQSLAPNGSFVDDFKIVEAPKAIHVLNAPSPAATASLAIGQHIARLAADRFDLK
jgi:(S)-2-hydroxyglutarate dehydrogenase